MQFHHHGYVSGNPLVYPAAGVGIDRHEELPDIVDVLIVGTGPAGMIAVAQLSQFPGITTRIIERREGRLAIGEADGIQARSVETFQAFGFAERITAEAYSITEVAFWKPADPSKIIRTAVAPDDPAGVSEFPHLIVNQARVLDHFAEVMIQSPTHMTPDYGWEFRGLQVADHGDHPVSVTLLRTKGEPREQRTIRAGYVIGADGARSRVREAIGCTLDGDQANHAWGVDVLAVTDFRDIRTKCAIQSGSGGNLLLIMYVDLGEAEAGREKAVRATTIDQIIARANAIRHPYRLDLKNVPWHGVYEVGHPRWLQSRLEAGARHRGQKPRIPPRHLFGRTSGDRQGSDRFRP